jgi:fructokinase
VPGPVLFVGESLVDLICERPVASWAEADSFVPHCGGAPTNAAIVAARCGVQVALGGGCGDDHWGRWLETQLVEERIDLRWWQRSPAVQTAIAFDVIDADLVPDFLIYGQAIAPVLEALAPKLEEALAACSALVLGSNTLVGLRERKITTRAHELAASFDKPLIVDVNLRAQRWPDLGEACEIMRALCRNALLVKANAEEARLLSGMSDAAEAAAAICSQLGARASVVTLGPAGALARGEVRADVPGVQASVLDTTGAGDALTGVLVAALARAAFDPAAIARALPAAVEIAARSTERYGATEALPARIELPSGL